MRLRLLPFLALPTLVSSCGDCAGVGTSRLAESEHSLRVGDSFLAGYEEGGLCIGSSSPGNFRPASTQWYTADTAIVELDTLSGLVVGKRVGDARVFPVYGGAPNGAHLPRLESSGASILLVRVR
jgi:hypothetical protein